MKSTGKVAALLLLAFFVAGCGHRSKVLPPAAAQAPTLPVSQSAANMPPPQMPPAELPEVNPPAPPAPQHTPKRHHPVHHKVKHTEVPADETPTASQDAELAAAGAASDITPL